MTHARMWLSVLTLLATATGVAHAQDTVLVLETTFEGGISDAVAEQFRAALTASLGLGEGYVVVDEATTRAQLGAQADRLMQCGSDAACLSDLGRASGATAAVVAAVGEAADIYAFTVDVYDLSDGSGVYFGDDDCALCTVDEAVAVLGRLGTQAADEIERIGAAPVPVARGETITLFIRAEPSSARISLEGEPLGTGAAEAVVGPGSYRLVVSAEGYEEVDETLEVAEGDDDKVVNVRLRAVGGTTAEGPRGPAGPAEPAGPTAGGRSGGVLDDIDTTVLGSILVGTGLAAMVTGVVLLAIDSETTCSEGAVTECPEVYETTAGGTVLTIVGASALTGGVLFLLWETLAGPPAPARPASPSAGDAAPTRVGFGFDGRSGFVTLGGAF